VSAGIRTQALRFAVVGVANTIVSFVIYAGQLALGVWYVIAAVVAYLGGLANGYTLNRRWTFSVGRMRSATLVRYTIVQVTGLLLSLAILSALVELAGVPELAAQVLSWPAVIAYSFVATRSWAFAPGSQPGSWARRSSSLMT
jgi:putative flippase GtrA